jgi:PAS domain S-box-containing protein
MVPSPRTILIVDDSPEDRELYRRYLSRDQEYSYTVLEGTLGRQGLELWQKHRPDVALLDYRLPDLDGLEFLARLQSLDQRACLPVIIVTGQGNEAIAVQSMKAGAQDYLVKEQITPEGLHLAVNGVVETTQLRAQLQQRIEKERLVAQTTQKIHQSLDLEEILQTTVTEVRQFLQTDRVVIFRLQPDGWGTVVTESVGAEWIPLLSTSLYDPCCHENYIEAFRQGLVTVKPDIYHANISPCHIELLTKLQVRANLVVPIIQDNQLWGLLVAHHCADIRHWQPLEVDLLKELATQLGIALKQAELYQQVQKELVERRRIEVDLRESKEKLSLFVKYAPVCVAMFDRNMHYITASQHWVNVYHLGSIEGILGRSHYELLPNISNYWRQVHQQGLAGMVTKCDEDRFILPDGSLQCLRWEVHPWRTDTGEVGGILIFVEDITERHQAEQERDRLLKQEQAARAEAERANRIKDEFLAILSHELRSPLNPILGWSQLLQVRKFNAAKTAEGLATIERNAKLQTQLIDDLLDVAKILRGKLSMNVAPVNLVFVIESAIETVRAAAVAKSILINAVLSQIQPVSGDAARLQQIVWNLLSNAIKFTPNHGRIDVQLSLVTDQPQMTNDNGQITKYAQITVRDTGKGIKPEFLPHIFESFRQEDASTTRKYGGLGLGLAIVRYLVEAHGGTIWVDSQGEGKGATFTVQLPLLNSETTENQLETLASDELDLTGIRVLTVDDEPDTRELLTAVLSAYGADVLTVNSAAEVLANLATFQPDVLVSDIGMPEMDGYTLIRQIRALPPEEGGNIPAVALTAYAREDDQQRAINCGYQMHLTKPFEPEQLVRSVTKLTSDKPDAKRICG